MIIYHSQHDKNSRDFITKYGDGHTVYDYPSCIEQCNTISSFPSIVIEVPAYYQELEIEEIMNEETNEIEEVVIEEPGNRDKHTELFAFYEDLYKNIDDFWEKAMDFKNMVELRAKNFPIR